MATTTAADWTHSHVFDASNPLAEKKTLWAVILTALMMVVEITGGYLFNSMALLADGWHMSSHALALGLAVLAYAAARRFKHDARFAFGTWKIEVLGGYTSAILLMLVAAFMLYQSVERLMAPTPIQYNQAIPIAVVGLLVNLACAWLLKDGHSHDHDHHHNADASHHHDLNPFCSAEVRGSKPALSRLATRIGCLTTAPAGRVHGNVADAAVILA